MDDFNVTSLHESKNEWGARLLTILTPLIVEGFQSIYQESYSLCQSNNETEKHLMTFQNFLSRIPKWNANIVEAEQKRIHERSGCSYLEDLITCVHIIQLKLLTAVRVGSKQKKIDVKIPNIKDFIHKVYIHAARKLYKNVYLFERNIPPLQIQKNARELELLVQEAILNSVREGIPVDVLLRSYLDETTEEDVEVNIKEEEIEQPTIQTSSLTTMAGGDNKKSLTFSEENTTIETDDLDGNPSFQNEKRLEQDEIIPSVQSDSPIQTADKLHIGDDAGKLTHEDIHSLDTPSIEVIPDLLIDDIEVL